MRRQLSAAASLMLAVCVAAGASAQTESGSLKGFVSDQSSGVLPGVTVSVTGPTLMGTRVAVTDQQGFYRLVDLPPGEYLLRAELLGFATIEQPEIGISVGLNISLDLVMKIGPLTETVHVVAVADTPLLEAETAERSFNVSGDFLRALPLTSRSDWWDSLRVVPGVRYVPPGAFETHGSGDSSHVFLLDGFDISDVPGNTVGGTRIPPDGIEDIKITTAGHDAASRMAVGTNLGIVTRSGGNTRRGTFSTNLQFKRLNDSNIPGGSPADQTSYQYSSSLGGPILKDRLWFFGSHRYIDETDGIARKETDIAIVRLFQPDFQPFDRRLPSHLLLAKGTYQVTGVNRIIFTYQDNRTQIRNLVNDPRATRERALGQDSGGPLYGLTWQRTFGQRATFRAQASDFRKPSDGLPQGTGPNIRMFGATILGQGRLSGSGPIVVDMGNTTSVSHAEWRRSTVNAEYTYFLAKRWGSHELRAGTHLLPHTEYKTVNRSTNDGFVLEDRVLVNPANPAAGARAFHRQYQDPVMLDGTRKSSRAWGSYVQDTWRPERRWVINAGVRIDKAETFDTWGDRVQSSWQAGPRLGAVYRVTGDGRHIVRASFNRMFDAINTGFAFSEGLLRKGTRDEYDLDGDGAFETVLTSPAVVTRPAPTPGTNRGIVSPDLKQPRTDEFTASYSRQLPWKITADITFIHRAYKDKMVAIDTNGLYENGRFLGYRDPTFNQIFEVRNGSENWLVYRALEASLHKNLSHNLQFLVGYSLADLRIDGTWDQNDPASFLQPDAFPNSRGLGKTVTPATAQVNSYQTAFINSGTPPHSYTLHLTYIAPFGITVGISHVLQMGQYSGPIFTLIPQSQVSHPATVTLSNGRIVSNPLATRIRFFYPTRDEGQLRAPSYNVLNVRVGKRFTRQRRTFEVAMQAFNVFNQGEDLLFDLPAVIEGQPSTFTRRLTQPPRAGQITLRVGF